MEPQRFDTLTKLVAARPSRRQVLRLLAGGLFGAAAAPLAAPAAASGCCSNYAISDCAPNQFCFYGGDKDTGVCVNLGVNATCGPAGGNVCCCGGKCCADADCGPGGTCDADGTCVCPVGQIFCGQPQTRGSCVDLNSDFNNCGSCGTSCALFGDCVSGHCLCPPDLPTVCENNGHPICVDLTKGFGGSFCGSCEALDCLSGVQACCGGQCTAIDDNNSNCGGCGNLCASTPGTRAQCCNGACVDLLSNNGNCGACGHLCFAGAHCVNGSCVTLPPCRGQRCNAACRCPGGGLCQNGVCRRRV